MFGSIMGDLEDDPIFGVHMRQMRQMNSMMNSLLGPFGGGMFNSPLMLNAAPHFNNHHQDLMPFGGNINRLMSFPDPSMMGGASYSSSSFMSMTSGPDGRPQIYQASSSTKAGPNGVVETKKTVQDSRTGIKKMAIGHHIGERGHIIEREQNVHHGTQEERQDFINLEEEDADDFNREFMQRSRPHHHQPSIQCIEGPPGSGRREMLALPSTSREPDLIEEVDDDDEDEGRDGEKKEGCREEENRVREEIGNARVLESRNTVRNPVAIHGRRSIRTHSSSPLATNSGRHHLASVHHPYNVHSRKSHGRPMKGGQQHHQQHPNQYRGGADN